MLVSFHLTGLKYFSGEIFFQENQYSSDIERRDRFSLTGPFMCVPLIVHSVFEELSISRCLS